MNNFMHKIAKYIQSSMQNHPIKICFIAGGISSLAISPLYFWIFGIIGYGFLFHMSKENASKYLQIKNKGDKLAKRKLLLRSFLYGEVFGLCYFSVGLYWLIMPFFADPSYPSYLFFLAVPILTSLLGLFFAFAILFFTIFYTNSAKQNFFIFVLVIIITDELRSLIFTGLPLNLTGHVFGISNEFAQIASVFGIKASGVFVLIWYLLFHELVTKSVFPRKLIIACIIMLPLIIYGFGAYRIDKYNKIEQTNSINIKLVQANVKISEIIDPSNWSEIITKQLQLSKPEEKTANPTLVIWPENAAPYYKTVPQFLDVFSANLPNDSIFITGSISSEIHEKRRFYNILSIMHINDDAYKVLNENSIDESKQKNYVVAEYKKNKLVPFGEYMPFSEIFTKIPAFNGLSEGFSKGEKTKVIHSGKVSILPLICYEIIFSEYIKDAIRKNEGKNLDAIILVTNDGWFDKYFAPKQLLDQSRFRAIETGYPVLRSAATGISANISPIGEVIAKSKADEVKIINSNLKEKNPTPTLYINYGELIIFLLYFAIILQCLNLGCLNGQRK